MDAFVPLLPMRSCVYIFHLKLTKHGFATLKLQAIHKLAKSCSTKGVGRELLDKNILCGIKCRLSHASETMHHVLSYIVGPNQLQVPHQRYIHSHSGQRDELMATTTASGVSYDSSCFPGQSERNIGSPSMEFCPLLAHSVSRWLPSSTVHAPLVVYKLYSWVT